MKRIGHSLFVLLLAVVAISGTTQAQEADLTRTWDITPARGMDAQFDMALKAHAEMRMAQNDPWEWSVFVYETGPMVGSYHIRSGGHTWADFDAYDAATDFQAVAGAHWSSVVDPLVESASSAISRSDTSISTYPADWSAIKFVTVTWYTIAPGQGSEFMALIKQAHSALRAANFDASYGWGSSVSGGPGGTFTLAGFHRSWADMEAPSPNFAEIMTKSMGEKKFAEWSEKFGKTFTATESAMLRWRHDLSVMKR